MPEPHVSAADRLNSALADAERPRDLVAERDTAVARAAEQRSPLPDEFFVIFATGVAGGHVTTWRVNSGDIHDALESMPEHGWAARAPYQPGFLVMRHVRTAGGFYVATDATAEFHAAAEDWAA